MPGRLTSSLGPTEIVKREGREQASPGRIPLPSPPPHSAQSQVEPPVPGSIRPSPTPKGTEWQVNPSGPKASPASWSLTADKHLRILSLPDGVSVFLGGCHLDVRLGFLYFSGIQSSKDVNNRKQNIVSWELGHLSQNWKEKVHLEINIQYFINVPIEHCFKLLGKENRRLQGRKKLKVKLVTETQVFKRVILHLPTYRWPSSYLQSLEQSPRTLILAWKDKAPCESELVSLGVNTSNVAAESQR